MKTIIYNCDICGKDIEENRCSFILPVLKPKSYDDYLNQDVRKIGEVAVDLCDECAHKIYKSFSAEIKDGLQKLIAQRS